MAAPSCGEDYKRLVSDGKKAQVRTGAKRWQEGKRVMMMVVDTDLKAESCRRVKLQPQPHKIGELCLRSIATVSTSNPFPLEVNLNVVPRTCTTLWIMRSA